MNVVHRPRERRMANPIPLPTNLGVRSLSRHSEPRHFGTASFGTLNRGTLNRGTLNRVSLNRVIYRVIYRVFYRVILPLPRYSEPRHIGSASSL